MKLYRWANINMGEKEDSSTKIREIFDNSVESIGGIYNPQNYPPQWNVQFEYTIGFYKQNLQAWKNETIPDVNFYFIDNKNINARAFIEQDHWFIGMNTGTLLVIYYLFNAMLADPRIFPWIGNSNLEDTSNPTFTFWNTNFDDLVFTERHLVTPKDPVRRHYALLLYEIAISFLFSHEYAHLCNGHVSYLDSLTSCPLIEEFEFGDDAKSAAPDKYKLMRQTLECDADTRAIGTSWRTLESRFNNKDQIYKEYRPFFEKSLSAILTNIFSISSVFQLFETNNIKLESLYSNYHPQVTIRSFMIFSSLLEMIKLEMPTITAEWVAWMFNGVYLSSEAFEIITGFKVDDSYHYKNMVNIITSGSEARSNSDNYMSSICDEWEILRPKLLPFSHFGLPKTIPLDHRTM